MGHGTHWNAVLANPEEDFAVAFEASRKAKPSAAVTLGRGLALRRGRQPMSRYFKEPHPGSAYSGWWFPRTLKHICNRFPGRLRRHFARCASNFGSRVQLWP